MGSGRTNWPVCRAETPDTPLHQVGGDGEDSEQAFSYFLTPPAALQLEGVLLHRMPTQQARKAQEAL